MSTIGMIHAGLGMTVLVTGSVALAVRKKRGWHSWMGEIYHWAWLLMAITAMWVGWQNPGISVFEIITPPSYLLALSGYVAGKRRTRLSPDWLSWHINGMGGSYIAVITATGFLLWPRLGVDLGANPLLFWGWMLLPGSVGGWLLGRTDERWTGKARRARAARAATAAAAANGD